MTTTTKFAIAIGALPAAMIAVEVRNWFMVRKLMIRNRKGSQ